MTVKAWKLFEVTKNLEPRSLVHGHYYGFKSTRIYALDAWIPRSLGTPGFNVFSSYQDMVDYLPKFRKRKTRLVGCEIHASQLLSKPNSKYFLCENIFIPKINWTNRVVGSDMLILLNIFTNP